MIFYLPEFFVQAFLRLVFSYLVDIGQTDFLEVGIQTNSTEREFLEKVKFFREWIEHFLPASFCGRVGGWNEPLQEAESELINGDL